MAWLGWDVSLTPPTTRAPLAVLITVLIIVCLEIHSVCPKANEDLDFDFQRRNFVLEIIFMECRKIMSSFDILCRILVLCAIHTRQTKVLL